MTLPDIHSLLLESGPRLPSISRCLTDSLWSPERYASMDKASYLAEGEKAVTAIEETITLGAPAVWDELATASSTGKALASWFGLDNELPAAEEKAAVVFDGLSLREIPLLLELARTSGFEVVVNEAIATTLPTETLAFVRDRLLGKPVAPSSLPGRSELRSHGVEAFYLSQPNTRENFPKDRSILVWSSYPDRLYFDDAARSDELFSQFHALIPTIWKYAVQALPPGLPIVITSDHGYQFFGPGMESNRKSAAPEILGQARNRTYATDDAPPAAHPDIQWVPSKRLALLRGRVRQRPQGAASRKLYQHGGLSLMESLVPWLELIPQ